MNSFAPVRERLRQVFSRTKHVPECNRLLYPIRPPPPNVFGSYCPIISCTILHSLGFREKEALCYLTLRFVNQFGSGKKGDLLLSSDPRLLVALQRIFTGELRLFEAYFDVKFIWSGFEDAGRPFSPFPYTRQALAHYYLREALFRVGGRDCGNCQDLGSKACTSNMESKVKRSFRQNDASVFSDPTLDSFNFVQMAAWSLVTSISTVMVLGAAIGSDSTIRWGSELLDSWEPKIRQVMFSGSKDDVAGGTACPPYT